MAIQIQFRRGTALEWTTANPILADGEMAIETDTSLFKVGNGVDRWNTLAYGGLRGFAGSQGGAGYTGSAGSGIVSNVMYVSKSGNDLNAGDSLVSSKLTIRSALATATYGTTIFVKSGDYTEINPMIVPEGVAIVGDSLRTVTVRPLNKTQDMFWVNNAVYLAHMTFKDHESPSSAVAFNPDGSAGVIHTSPYVQNCTSMTTTGTGMRVDGAHADGLRSMVVDAYTQYNQGGIGIHMLNRGNTQLVSVFTICCSVGFLCEYGGFCSVTNSNSSFGTYALKSDGVSSTLYAGKVNGEIRGRTFVIDNLTTRPNVGDAVKFAGDDTYYTLFSSTPFTSGSTAIATPSYADESATARNLRQTVLDGKSKIQADTIDFLNETYLSFDYNEFKCTRDIGLIIDAVVDDMMFSTNYKSIQAGISYNRATASLVITGQLTETLAAVNFVKTAVLALMTVGAERTRVSNNFDIILAIMAGGTAPAYVWASPSNVDANKPKAQTIIQANRNFIIEEGIAYITANYSGLTYDQTKCRRDIGLIVDAVTYDVLYGGNSQTADAADEYYSTGTLQVPVGEQAATAATFNYIKSVVAACVVNTSITALNIIVTQSTGNPAASAAEATQTDGLFDIVTNLITNAYSSTIVLEESVPVNIADNANVSFHQFSLITSSGHTFEWIGAGTNVNTALPYLGGIPIAENQAVALNQGKIYYTGTDQRGDFRIGDGLIINRNTGTISGRTFTKSLFAVMTPYILAIGD
jgi:hypothetical protein